MAATLTLEVPDELFENLRRESIREGKTPEDLAVSYLESLIPRKGGDRLLRWVGAFASGVPDAGLRHDDYIGQAIYDEMTDDRGA